MPIRSIFHINSNKPLGQGRARDTIVGCQHESISSFSLSESMGGSTLKSMVVPATGRSPTLAHMGGLSTVPSIAAAIGIHPSVANRGKRSFHTHLGSPIGMHNSWSLMANCDSCGLKHTISWETKDWCKTRHHQQGGESSLFEGSSGPRHNPRCTALIVLKEGTCMPVSRPGAFGDRKEDSGCPFTNQSPCQAEV